MPKRVGSPERMIGLQRFNAREQAYATLRHLGDLRRISLATHGFCSFEVGFPLGVFGLTCS